MRRTPPSRLAASVIASLGALLAVGCATGPASLTAAPGDPRVEVVDASEASTPSDEETTPPDGQRLAPGRWTLVAGVEDGADGDAEADGPSDDPEAPAGPGYDVVAVQRTLAEHAYYGGAVDGKAGPQLRAAVMAFQKVHGLAADGVVGPNTLAALAAPRAPALVGGASTRLEVDLTRQVVYFVKDGRLARIMPTSSGNGATYATKGGGTARALTPTGTFRIERKISGVRKADLGILYDPLYFYRGWALHGSNSVPAYPASHGCARLTRWDASWLFPQVPVGTQVKLYGGTHVFAKGDVAAAGTDAPAGDTGAAPQPPPPAPAPPAPPTPPAPPPPASAPPSSPPPPSPPSAPPPSAPSPTTPSPAPAPGPASPAPSAPAPAPSSPAPAPSTSASTAEAGGSGGAGA